MIVFSIHTAYDHLCFADDDVDVCIPDNSMVHQTGKIIGHGAYGDVVEVAYRGNVICAAKKYRPADKETLKRTFGQDHLLCSIRHANLVAYRGIGTLPNDPSTVVMQRMNVKLDTYYLERKDVALVQKIRILHDMLESLNHLHKQIPHIVHRDLNGQNVLLDSRGVAKIGNQFMLKREPTSTVPAAAIDYMPPEALAYKVCNDRLDVFSFGHLSMYMINQCPPQPLQRPTYKDKKGVKLARSEVERHEKFFDQMKYELDSSETFDCLQDDSDDDILQSGKCMISSLGLTGIVL